MVGRAEKGGEENRSGIGNTKRVQEREERPVKKRGGLGEGHHDAQRGSNS